MGLTETWGDKEECKCEGDEFDVPSSSDDLVESWRGGEKPKGESESERWSSKFSSSNALKINLAKIRGDGEEFNGAVGVLKERGDLSCSYDQLRVR